MTHPDVRPDAVALAVPLQVPLDLLMGQEAAKLGFKGEVREHHHLLGQVGPVGISENINCEHRKETSLQLSLSLMFMSM